MLRCPWGSCRSAGPHEGWASPEDSWVSCTLLPSASSALLADCLPWVLWDTTLPGGWTGSQGQLLWLQSYLSCVRCPQHLLLLKLLLFPFFRSHKTVTPGVEPLLLFSQLIRLPSLCSIAPGPANCPGTSPLAHAEASCGSVCFFSLACSVSTSLQRSVQVKVVSPQHHLSGPGFSNPSSVLLQMNTKRTHFI